MAILKYVSPVRNPFCCGYPNMLFQEGDILIKVNGALITKFVDLDGILDNSVGKKVRMLVERGGKAMDIELDVGDLHAITPDRFLTVCGASFHDLSYQSARLYAIPVRGVYVCEPAGSFRFDGMDKGWIIEVRSAVLHHHEYKLIFSSPLIIKKLQILMSL